MNVNDEKRCMVTTVSIKHSECYIDMNGIQWQCIQMYTSAKNSVENVYKQGEYIRGKICVLGEEVGMELQRGGIGRCTRFRVNTLFLLLLLSFLAFVEDFLCNRKDILSLCFRTHQSTSAACVHVRLGASSELDSCALTQPGWEKESLCSQLNTSNTHSQSNWW